MIRRKIDDLGRVVIPKSLRDQMGLVSGDMLSMEWNGEELHVRKYEEPVEQNEKLCAAIDMLESMGYTVSKEKKVVKIS
jgi:AbrB family looped-hinge helix DNA binding protein